MIWERPFGEVVPLPPPNQYAILLKPTFVGQRLMTFFGIPDSIKWSSMGTFR